MLDVDVDELHTLCVLQKNQRFDPAIFQAIQARRCGRNGPVGDMDGKPEDLRSVRWLKGWLKGWEGCRFGRICGVFFWGGRTKSMKNGCEIFEIHSYNSGFMLLCHFIWNSVSEII